MRHSLHLAAASALVLAPLAAAPQGEGPGQTDAETRMRLYGEHQDLVSRTPHGDLR